MASPRRLLFEQGWTIKQVRTAASSYPCVRRSKAACQPPDSPRVILLFRVSESSASQPTPSFVPYFGQYGVDFLRQGATGACARAGHGLTRDRWMLGRYARRYLPSM